MSIQMNGQIPLNTLHILEIYLSEQSIEHIVFRQLKMIFLAVINLRRNLQSAKYIIICFQF